MGYAVLVIATIIVALGECFHTAALMPLVADLAPEHLRGRQTDSRPTTGDQHDLAVKLAQAFLPIRF